MKVSVCTNAMQRYYLKIALRKLENWFLNEWISLFQHSEWFHACTDNSLKQLISYVEAIQLQDKNITFY
jgi:hypothetical protein